MSSSNDDDDSFSVSHNDRVESLLNEFNAALDPDIREVLSKPLSFDPGRERYVVTGTDPVMLANQINKIKHTILGACAPTGALHAANSDEIYIRVYYALKPKEKE